MARKSNKTEHVLGLITKEKAPAPVGDDESPESAKPQRKAIVRKTAPPILDTSGDVLNKLSEDIRGKLLEELDGPVPLLPNTEAHQVNTPATHESDPEVVPDGIPVNDESASIPTNDEPEPTGIPVSTIQPPQMPASENPPLEAPVIQTVVADFPLEDFGNPELPVQASIPVSPPPHMLPVTQSPYAPEAHGSYMYINVLEELIKERIIDHMKSFEVCLCNRCIMDTIALALTNLPSKYIVAENGQGIPLLNYYGTRLQIQVISELTKACMIVKNSPHH